MTEAQPPQQPAQQSPQQAPQQPLAQPPLPPIELPARTAHLSGWRLRIQQQVEALLTVPMPDEHAQAAGARAAVLTTTLHERENNAQLGLWHRLTAFTEASAGLRAYEEALANMLAIRNYVLEHAGPENLRAWVPMLRDDVKRLVARDEPIFDSFLSTIERIQTTTPPRAPGATQPPTAPVVQA